MNSDNNTYKQYAEGRAKKSPIVKNCVSAFCFGGLVCVIAEGLRDIYTSFGMEKDAASSLVSVTLIFVASLLTGIGVFDNIAKVAGAGVLVPITGFSNAMTAPAIDTKSEGFVLGVGAKIFTIAGPVILYGTLAGALYGAVYWICKICMGM